jgi:hypothetical protein
MPRGLWDLPIQLWGLEMSLGNRQAASEALGLVPAGSAAEPLADAARLCMDHRFDAAFELLESRRSAYPTSRILDVPAARLALLARRPVDAAAILEQRMPGVVSGDEPIDARNVLPALDLAAAWSSSERRAGAAALLDRIVTFLDGPDAPHWPMFSFLRARTHAIGGETEAAMQALDRAYEAGFRTTWAVDVMPQAFMYIDPVRADPAFASLHGSPRYTAWLERIETDNSRQLARVKAHELTSAGGRNAELAGDVN